jgi:hypothetical protein
MENKIDPWELSDPWQLEEGPDGEVNQIEVEQTIAKPQQIVPIIESDTITCILCGTSFETKGLLRVCTPCWNGLISAPKVHLHLIDSDKYEQGVVTWDHGNIGGSPYDKDAVPIGVWGKYGMEGEKLSYWVSLCQPIEAIHDMMTQFQAAVSSNRALFNAQIKYGDRDIDNTGTGYKPYSKSGRSKSAPKPAPQPYVPPAAPISASDKLKNFLGR